MNTFFAILLVGISLSMDAFSLALVYGTQGLSKREEVFLSVIVGLFHFFMPLIGFCFGNVLANYFIFNVNIVVGIIFNVIGIEMIISSVREDDVSVLVSFWGFLLFGLSVSIDSLTTGIGLRAISDNYLEVSSIFMICSGLFTYLGLIFGNKLSARFGKMATILGGGMLIILAIYYVFR
jgi:putative Mn2+ efflux pump MntP